MANLSEARNKARELRFDLPRRSGKVQDNLRLIRSHLEAEGPDILPSLDLKVLEQKIDDLVVQVEHDYPDPEDRIDEPPRKLVESLVELDASLDVLHSQLIESACYRDLVRYLKRIDSVLPPADYDFTNQIDQLRYEKADGKIEWLPSARDCLDEATLNGLKESLQKFRDRQYEDALRCASQSNQRLIQKLLEYLTKNFANGEEFEDLRVARKKVWEKLREAGQGRLEGLVIALAELSKCIRNCVEHPEDEGVPDWMIERRKLLRQDPCVARLALVCQLHLAVELHQLWQNEFPNKLP